MAVINTNIMSLTTQNNLNKSQSALGTAIERLSSGLRINSAKDDAAGQAIANRMTAQVKGMTQAARNANDGISLTQTAEGNLNEINNNLQRIRELATQAANDPNGKTDRDSIVKEMTQRINEVNRVAQSASFNGTKLLDGSASAGIIIQVGANTGTTETITIDSSALINATTGTGGTMNDVGTKITALGAVATGSANTAAQDLITSLDTALSAVDAARSNLGAIQNRFESTITNLNNSINNLSSARSRIEDADYATEVSNMSRSQILQQAGTSVLSQANQVPQTVLSLLR
ncbi:flagellin [Pectobacterium versatile]|uniref:flagellin N-terminal helical domain-containing protein n=1 Tax=Pectobacterium versatile TaxID=2488639 RepID=UPI0020852380|nr:flagellin [Pectobacterium versatile]GKV80735.1 flagellin [Pectobacterium carotovorum subsp. carotovorum]GKW33020.1 flagellin [Pectobacterium carotovorum subsp. carotovorum]GKX39119.1 flagellin [Pectobacterium carotovorum subsp. carotovorum]GLX45418.1 flagellin [Pectobacterium carotovorum subsp. carotovorum]